MVSLMPYFFLGAAVCALIAAAIHSQRTAVKLDRRSWQQLVSDLQRIHFEGLTIVAKDFLEPRKNQIALEPSDLWELVGGYEGLRRMRANAKIMMTLAAFAQQWNFEEGVVVAERMRRDAARLTAAVRKVEFSMLPYVVLRHRWLKVPFCIHEAASSYYLMRQRLLALYETSHAGLYPQLAEAL